MSLSGGEVMLDVLRAYGVDHIFCSPGTEWVPVWECLAKLKARGERIPEYINCRHESLAVAMAFGYSKATGRLPAVLLHASVGALQGAMAIRAAYQEQVPMLICAGDSSGFGEDEDDDGSGWRWSRSLSDVGGPASLVKPFVKWGSGVTSKENLPGFVHRGCAMAQAPPKGPVFLSIPWEFLLKSFPEVRIPPPLPAPAPPLPDPAALEDVAQRLQQGRNPIILTEHAGTTPDVVAKLVELAELLSIPVFEALRPDYVNFPKDHPLHAGYDAAEALQEADVVFIVGGTNPWPTASAFPKDNTEVILLDQTPLNERQPYWGYRIDLLLTGDIGRGLSALVDIIRPHTLTPGPHSSRRQARFERWRAKHEQLAAIWETEALAAQGSKPIAPKWFLYTVNRLLPHNALILQETVTHSPLIHRYLHRAQPDGYFDVTFGGLGLGMGKATGMKLARPDRPVIYFVGDGSFNYNPVLACLGFCQEYHLPILTIVLNNGGYAAMKLAHQKLYPEGWAVKRDTFFGEAITPGPNYTRVAEAFDAYGERVEVPDDIEPALNRALRQVVGGRAALLDVILDPRST